MNRDQLAITAIRVLSAQAIQKAKSGHPGMPLGAAPMGYALWSRQMKHNPADPQWIDRDRFVLSAGHGSMLLYSLLHLSGYDVTMDDIRDFRQLNSRTPGHPEYGVTAGVDDSTGPLGQGIANAVGFALAERHLAATFNRPGYEIVNHYTYCILGDGCLMEGISQEALSIAGNLKLNKLIALYDDNNISIEGNTDITFTEDIPARVRACGWNAIDLKDGMDFEQISAAIEQAKASDKPTMIICHTVIGYGSPKANSEASHGAPLGPENVEKTMEALGWPEKEAFVVPQACYEAFDDAKARGAQAEDDWNALMADYAKAYPELAEQWNRYFAPVDAQSLIDDESFWQFDKACATRVASGITLNRLAERLPNLIGGSADLGGSNNSIIKNRPYLSADNYAGSNIHFGVREHAMAAMCNGMRLHGGLLPYCATFFVFSDYMKNAMRMSALMGLNVPYILTHDSIGVGEDGPTHQPVEQLISLRATPNMTVFRPADAHETVAGWMYALTAPGPVSLILSRQELPMFEQTGKQALRGGYVLSDCVGTPDVILLASGSEVAPTMEAQKLLAEEGIRARVVSMPCMELFDAQSDEYKQSVLPRSIRARVAVEAGSSYSWHKYVGLDGATVCMDAFGKSAPAKVLFQHFGFTPENIAATAKSVLAR